MSDENITPARKWQEIAAEAAQEKESENLAELTNELCAALDARDEKLQQMKRREG